MNDLNTRAGALNFSWIEEGLVAGCRGPRTEKDLALLKSLGVKALVRLAPEDEAGLKIEDVGRYAIRDCYEPVRDWTAPSQMQIDRIVHFIKEAIANGEAVAVSCGAEYGRTGTILGCYLVSQGLSATAAIQNLVGIRPCSSEILRIPEQKNAVSEFHRRVQEIKRNPRAV